MAIENLLAYLFEIVETESKTLRKTISSSKAGFKLEDSICLKIAEFCIKYRMDYVNVYPPRYDLDLPTFSGERHQLDLVIQHNNTYFLGESKRREGKGATKDQLRCFSAKLIDYGLGAYKSHLNTFFRGLFLSTDNIPDPTAVYAIGCGITVISPYFPPVEYLLSELDEASMLRKNLNELKKEISVPWPSILECSILRREAHEILESYKQYLALWKEEVAGV